MAKKLFVTAPLVVFKMTDGTRQHVYAGAPVPEGVDGKHRDELVKAGMVESREVPTAPTGESAKSGDENGSKTYTEGADPADFNVGQVKAYVGDDPAKASAVLELEQKRSDAARSGLVKHLQAVANPQPQA